MIKIYLHNPKIKQNLLKIFWTISEYQNIFLIYMCDLKIKQNYPKIKQNFFYAILIIFKISQIKFDHF